MRQELDDSKEKTHELHVFEWLIKIESCAILYTEGKEYYQQLFYNKHCAIEAWAKAE